MLINTDLSPDASLASRQNRRADRGATASQSSAGSPASQLDPSLQRLTGVLPGAQDADWEIQDEQAAGQAVEAARQGMFQQPGAAMSAQANQLYQNVLDLLQPAD